MKKKKLITEGKHNIGEKKKKKNNQSTVPKLAQGHPFLDTKIANLKHQTRQIWKKNS